MLNFKTDIDLQSDLLIVSVGNGPEASPEVEQWREGILVFCRESPVARILIDAHDYQSESGVDELTVYEFTSMLAKELTSNQLPVQSLAIVLPAQGRSREIVEFATNVASNRGIRVRAFGDKEQALSFLSRTSKLQFG